MGSEETKRYWKSWDEVASDAEASTDEFPEPLDSVRGEFSRRDFLKAAGFTLAAGTALVGCGRAPVEKAIPFLIQPEEILPGRSYFYASTCAGCSAGCGVLVKTRDGRPIKLEGNPEHPLSRGGLCAVGQASLLELYDSQRLQAPLAEGKPGDWAEADRAVVARLAQIREQGGAVRFLTGTITSPTLRAELDRFLSQFRDARRVSYDPLSTSAILDAHERTHGARVLPRFRFERAELIASFDADFLGTWISPVEFTAGYRAGRNLEANPPRFSYHVQLESRLSLTGSKADRRFRIAPRELGAVVTQLAARVAKQAGVPFTVPAPETASVPAEFLDDLARRLWLARGRSLIVCGSQDVQTQILVNFLNQTLGNYGKTVDIEQPALQREGSDRELEALLRELADGKVAALFVLGANPVYDLPNASELAQSLKRIPLLVSFAERADETASFAHYVCPQPHFLESWGDAEAVAGTVSLFQPALNPLGRTRPAMETLSAWTGERKSAYEILQARWKEHVFPQQKGEASFQTFWDKSVERGFAEIEAERVKPKPFRTDAVKPAPAPRASADALALVLYPKVSMLDGRHAHNAWLQELPDPISKVTWDNYACLSPATASRLGAAEGDVIRLDLAGGKGGGIELPAYIQPGQHDEIVAVALGYGREGTDRFAKVGPQWLFGRPGIGGNGLVGVNAAPLLTLADGALQYTREGVRITKMGKQRALACTQKHHSLTTPANIPLVGGKKREIVEETALPVFLEKRATSEQEAPKKLEDLWPADHPYTGHRWAMAIDLTACTGCSACVIACQAENNIPVVGQDEVRRQREMHWIRIDRYYAGADDVDVVHQPMMCQQCDHAPCETVCPVLATVHSEEGLNQQIYNRCVGTRYCANNCPYKTRRFNWFAYAHEDKLQNLVLNPDVTVRSRGIMEKCTFCVQRIQEVKIEARKRGEPVADGAVQTACQQSCPAQAIVFGDLNDPKSRIAEMARNPRRYRVLEDFNFQPAVSYLEVVRNRASGEETGKNV